MNYFISATCLLFTFFSVEAWATCTQELSYRGKAVQMHIMENFGSDRPLLELITEAEKAIPMLHGWEGELTPTTDHHLFYFACGQHDQVSYWIDGEKSLEHACNPRGITATMKEMLEGLGWSGHINGTLRGYTIQIAYLREGQDGTMEWQRWDEHIFKRAYSEATNEALSVVGDCVQQSLWSHDYPNGDKALRFGIYRRYQDALKDIERLELPGNHAQILPHYFSLEQLKRYIQH